MKDYLQDQTVLLLKRTFPAFESVIEPSFSKDPFFRDMATEYHECLRQEVIHKERGRQSDLYKDTIHELKEELFAYLSSLKSEKLNI